MKAPTAFSLAEPDAPLRWFGSAPTRVELDGLRLTEIWALAAIALLARADGPRPLAVVPGTTDPARFAHAVGLFDVIRGAAADASGQQGRTVKLTRITDFSRMEATAQQIAAVELWRNVVQHSQDPLGGVVAAQLNDRGRCAQRPMIQVAVCDGGIGIQKSLQRSHPHLADPQAAIQKALEPHISGTFEEGQTGSLENAGMGLFFISEMTKLVAGRLLVASRGAAFSLVGDPEFEGRHQVFSHAKDVGFPGTLVAFEMPAFERQDYAAMIETIRERAKERTPRRQTNRWLVWGPPAEPAQSFLVHVAGEDTQKAQRFAAESLTPLLVARKPVELNFVGIRVCTQSFLHALLFEPLRVAWALKTPIYVTNTEPAVRATLELLENYALSG